ncbi:DUF2207 domain-containing protein [Candidatus Bipolaricaulota bacterium]|nr:DUF2207 domain-containing protein [Candidatus Bipolaricaulota bacterium]
MMRIGRTLSIACLLLISLTFAATAELRIQDFAVDILADASGQLIVTENITVRFITPHHGIERFITISGKTPWGETVKIDLQLEEILLDNSAVPYTTSVRGSNRYLRIGDPDQTITGTYKYSIHYRVNRAWLFDENAIRLYWNVTGNEWDIPIERASATLQLPDSVNLTSVSSITYLGYYGSSERGAAGEATQTGELVFQSAILYPGEGMTIDVSIPREMLPIEPPTIMQRILYFLDANKVAALPFLTLLGMYLLWLNLGKDPRKRVIAPVFAPPRDLHPGAVGVLIDDRIDLHDISAMLIGLAVKGYLSIQEPAEGEYVFVRKRPTVEDLSPAEQAMFEALFDTPETEERSLASLEQKFYKSLPTIKSRLIAPLIEAGYYKNNPERIRSFYAGIGMFALPLAVYLGIQSASVYVAVSVSLSALVILAFSPFMPRKTTKGVRKLEEILGLSEYIRKAEVDRMEFHNAPEKGPKLFEKLLPYAIALNLTKIWTRQFDGLLTEPPQWYVGSTQSPVFNALVFSHTLTGMTQSMQQTFVSAPRSSGKSAYGGRSSFGGGFSGGGMGGGGGGGW